MAGTAFDHMELQCGPRAVRLPREQDMADHWLKTGTARAVQFICLCALLVAAAVPAAAATPKTAAAAPTGYVLGPDDVISVVVYGQNEFNMQTRIKPDGTVVMPLIGKVPASGKTVITLADDIADRLEKGNYLRDPIVNVEIVQYNSRYVRVVGKVGSPTLIALDRPYQVLDVLLRAGWVRQDGSRYVLLRRASDGRQLKLDTDELARAVPGSEVYAEPGDTLFIEPAEVVYLTGQVARPGAYQLEPGMTIAKLIAKAGGVGPNGSSGKFGVKRAEGKEQSVDDQFVLQKDDVVNVKERLF